MNHLKKVIWILWGFCFTVTGWAQINIQLPQLKVMKNDTIIVPIKVGDLQNHQILACQIDVRFRSEVVTALGIQCDGCITQNWAELTEQLVNLDTAGLAKIGLYGPTPLETSGVLVNLMLLANGTYGDTTTLFLDQVSFNAGTNGDPHAIVQHGFLEINAQPITIVVKTNIDSNTTVMVDDKTYPSPYTTYWEKGATHKISVTSPQLDGTETRHLFSDWNDGGEQTHSVTPTTQTTYIANFETKYRVQVHSAYGNPQGAGWYLANSQANIQVDSLVAGVPGTRSLFDKWKGAGAGAYNGRNASANIVVRGPIVQTAFWQTQYELKVKTAPYDLAAIKGSGWYDSSQVVTTAKAPEIIGEGETAKKFLHWIVDGQKVDGNPISITMDTSHVAVAVYRGSISVTITTNIEKHSTVIVDNDTLTAPVTVFWTQAEKHTIGVPEFQNYQNGYRYIFQNWSDQGARLHEIAPKSDSSFVAHYQEQVFVDIQTDPPDVAQITQSGWYASNSKINLGPVPEKITFENTPMSFLYWHWNGLFDYRNELTLTLDQPYLIVARYLNDLYIHGIVQVNDTPVPNVKVYLTHSQTDSFLTGRLGDFFFAGLNAASYTLKPQAAGLEFQSQEIPIQLTTENIKGLKIEATDVQTPQVQVVFPNGGEMLKQNEPIDIQWRASDNVKLDSLEIYYSTNDAGNWMPIAKVAPGDSTYAWMAPMIESEKCKLLIRAVDIGGNAQKDESDNFFKISESVDVANLRTGAIYHFTLHPSFPNPFNPRTEIDYEIPRAGVVNLKVYNLAGQEVATLVNGFKNAGQHQVIWHANGLPSGIYFGRLQFGNRIMTCRMVLAK